ncbi:hypothetical protein WICPIJ_008758 [Wickerhamomyces pijperi]|uniref:Uncharacterized protein n=1 Tax=Wickerhamomyces pijperi TaxID=599730 RepID=A0A9P8PWR1_WICPI|nr:hypothetical protein WICPIJ_008758 [Wickerhamomyces pijperi]
MTPTTKREVGIGNPSKYLDLPVRSLGIVVTVTLNLAVNTKTSMVDWNPIAKAIEAGATPKLIKSAKLSNSWPIKDDLFLNLATLPSKKSKNNPKTMKICAR